MLLTQCKIILRRCSSLFLFANSVAALANVFLFYNATRIKYELLKAFVCGRVTCTFVFVTILYFCNNMCQTKYTWKSRK